jgi:predicted ester cyclase
MRSQTCGLVVLAIFAATGCNKNEAEGSSGTGSATPVTAAAKPAPLDAQGLLKRFRDCWGYGISGSWKELEGCYAAKAISELPGSGLPELKGAPAIVESWKGFREALPDDKAQVQLAVVDGRTIAAIVLVSGTHNGTLRLPTREVPATKRPVGVYLAQVLAFDDAGKITRESIYLDLGTLIGQVAATDHPVREATDKLAMTEVIGIARDDAKEKANIGAIKQLVDTLDKHDATAVGGMLTERIVWSEQPLAKDLSKKEILAALPQLWKGFSDLKLKLDEPWTGGDWVAVVGSFEGTHDGDFGKIKKTGKKVSLPFVAFYQLADGKLERTWLFYQGDGFAKQLGVSR